MLISMFSKSLTIRSGFLVLCLELLLASAASASCIGLGGDERLQNYCLLNAIDGKAIDHRTAKMVDSRLRRAGSSTGLGFPRVVAFESSSMSFSVRPLLSYEANINGGNPDKPLMIGNLTFNGDEALYKTSGAVAGLGAILSGRTIYGEDKYLNYNFDTSYALSSSSDDRIATTSASVCSLNHIANSWYIDACANQSRMRKTLSDSSSSNLKLMAAYIFTSATKEHSQVKFGVNRFFADNYTQNQLVLGIDTLHPSSVFTGVEATFGEAIPEQLATRISVSGRVGLQVAGKPLTVNASFGEATGGLLFGVDRDAKSASISATYPVWRNFSATIGYTKTDSTIDYFDLDTPTLSIQFVPIEF